MGNSQTCVDCKTPVPKKVKWLDNIGGDWGQRFCKWTGNETWIKLGSDKYLCSPCLVKRQNQERQRQQEEERKKENERQEEKRRQDEKRQEEERRQEEMRREERRRQEERRQEERRQEEMRREEERRQEEMRKEEERRQEGMRREEERRQEKCRQEDMRKEEERRQEEMRREEKQQEDRRQDEKRQEEEVGQEQRKQGESLKQYEEQRQVMETHKGAEQRQSEDFEFERQDEKKNIKEGTDQLLLSEKRLSNWKRREKETSNETEHSQIIKESLSKRPNNDFNISSSPKYTSNPIHELSNYVLEQKDDRSVLQEMLDKGNFSEAQRVTISNVLLAVQENINSYENQDMFHRMRRSPDHQLLRKLCFKKSDFTDNEKEFPDCIFEICLAVKLTKKYWPRNTQITALCLLVKAIQKGILLEINTGEGKTCIVAMFSAFLGLSQTAVDIVSSSSILAQRDFVEWKTFYKLLNVSVSCNLTIKKTEERLKCYSNDVVYGTVGSFASDLLRQTFLMENVRGERKCEAVIVDEVDCLLLDQGIHFTYLSHVVPGMHHIEPILFMIWKHIVKHDKIVSDNSEHFFLGVLDSMHVVLSSYIDLSELCKKPNIPPDIQWLCLLEGNNLLKNGFTKDAFKENKSQYKKVFTIEKILECLEFIEKNFNVPLRFQPYIISNDTTVEAINPTGLSNDHIIHLLVVGEGLLCVLHPYEDEKDIHNFVKEEVKGYISFDGLKPSKHYIPSYLEEFVDNRLLHWIENAFTAKHMINGREYLVKDNDVLPVDFESTGVVQLDTKWGDCLHQFLEIKHGKKLSQITLVTNFMSNHEYFNRYQGKIFGVSGTLGTEKDSSFLMRQFSLACLKIPTHRSNVFNELPGIICSSKHEWITKIQNIVLNQVARTSNKGQRAVLVICEDINTANEMKNRLTGTDCSSVSLYTRNDENNDKINDKLKAGDVIVATNIAGRGTDVDIDESVEKAGGLFVLVTFLPQNTRIQNQVFGRSARKGQPGSAQIVIFFNRNSLPSYFSLHQFTDTTIMTIESLNILRDAIEEKRIVGLEKHAFEEVRLKEKLFARYCSFLLEIKKQLNFNSVDEKIMLNSLHEYWGMWLKMNCETNCHRSEHLESLLDFTLLTAKNKLFHRISPCSNLSHIVKFANEQLFDRNYALSIDLFTTAIDIDEKWAAIAYYNRAYCTLQYRVKSYIQKAIDDLIKSQKSFQLFKEEVILCLTLSSSMEGENNIEKEANSTQSQFNSRCQIINYFEENIKVSLQQLRECQKTNQEATAEGTSIFTIALGDDKTSTKIESELYIFWEMGLTELFFVKEKKPFCWKGMLVVALGVLQIAVGAVIIASTAGMLTQLGWGLIAEGVNDICTGAYAVWKGDQEFMKSWMIEKAVSIAVSVASFGYSQVKNAGVKATVASVKQHFKIGVEKVISEFKIMGSKMSSKSFGSVFKITCVEVGKDVGMQLAKRGEQYMLEVVQERLNTQFENVAEKSIKQETQLAFNEGEMHPMIDDFISFHCKHNTPKNQICSKYMEITKNLISSKNICQFRQLLLGCVKDVIKTTSKQLKANKNNTFEQCKPIFDIINGITCAPCDVKQLVSIYCKHVKTALLEIYTDSLNNEALSYFKDGDQDLCTIRQQIIDQTVQFLLTLLKESFQFTGSGILAEKLETAVGKCINEYCGDNNVGKETIRKIIAISCKAGKIGKDLATKGTIDVKTVVETGLDATETVVDVVADGNTKQIIGFGLHTAKASIQALQSENKRDNIDKFANEDVKDNANFVINATKKGVKAVQSGNTDDLFNAATEIASDGIEIFADGDIKKKANFALIAIEKGVKAVQSGKTDELLNAATEIVSDGIDKFADDHVKKTANFALNTIKKGVKAVQSGKTDGLFDASIEIAADGFEIFADDDVKTKAKFALNATKNIVKSMQSGKTDDLLDAATEIAADGIDKFADDDVKKEANFALNATKKGVKAMQSGKNDDLFNAVTDIAADGFEKFADDDVKKTANFAINATKKGVKAVQSGKTDDLFEAATEVAADAIEKFADEDVKKKANFALNSTKKGVKAVQSGKTDDLFDAATEVAADGIEKFADDDVKQTANFALNATKKGVKAVQSGKTDDLFDAATEIAADGIEKFADDDVKKEANFALNTTKKGVKAVQSGKTDDLFNAVTDIAADGIEKFADDDVKQTANFALNAAQKGVKAVQSGKTDDLFDAATEIAADGIEKFADDDVKKKANFALNATMKGVKAVQSGKTDDLFDAATEISADGIEKFADDYVKKEANFALNATKKGVKAGQSGKTDDLFNAATEIDSDGIEKISK